jgi:hypothetical protein
MTGHCSMRPQVGSKAPAGDELAGALGHLRGSARKEGPHADSTARFRHADEYYAAAFRIMRGALPRYWAV